MSNSCVVTCYPPSRARSVARASRKVVPISTVVGCAPPSTRRAIRSASSSVVTASWRSSSVALSSRMKALPHSQIGLLHGQCVLVVVRVV